MSIVGNNIKLDLSKYKSPGISVIEYDGHDYRPPITQDLINHINLLYELLGETMNFDKWHFMSDSDKAAYNRDLKINKIIE